MPQAQPPDQEREPGQVIDVAEARLAREEKMVEMEEAGEIIDIDGEKVPIENIDDLMSVLERKSNEIAARRKITREAIEGIDGGDLEEVKIKLEEENAELGQMEEKAENKRELLEAFKKFGGSLIKAGSWVPGGLQTGKLLDRYGGKLLTGSEGYFLTAEQHAELARKQAKLGKPGLKVIGVLFPEAKTLTEVAEPLRANREKLEAKKAEMARRGEEMPFEDQMAEIMKVVPDKSLRDEKVIGKIGEIVSAAGGDLGGKLGDKFGALGGFLEKNPEQGGKVLLGLKKLIVEKKFKTDPEIIGLINKHAIGTEGEKNQAAAA